MIQERYVSFEIAKLLKKKGFYESCFGAYTETNHNITMFNGKIKNSEYGNALYTAPTLYMTMEWLREMYNINIEIFVIKNYDNKICEYTYTIMDLNFPGSDDGIDCCNKFKTYEQACEAAIKYCLEHLVW